LSSPAYSDRNRLSYCLAAPVIVAAAKTINQIQEDYENDNPPDPAPGAVVCAVPAPCAIAAAGVAGIAVIIICVPAIVVTFIIAAATGRYLFVHRKNLL